MMFGIAGAGLSGAVVARELADAGHQVVLHEAREHIAGNCYTERDKQTGVMVHRYGPHVFHTNRQEVWNYVNGHADMMPYTLRVRSVARGAVYSLPINLATINQVFNVTLSPDEAVNRIEQERVHIEQPANLEEAALAAVGPTLYELLIRGYTAKQWGCDPATLPASVFRRLPLRFTYDDNYFDHPWQAIPRFGYTAMVESILDHPAIVVELGEPFPRRNFYDHTIWTGPLDGWFDYRLGRLRYRTLSFQTLYSTRDFQGAPIINYADESVSWTRVTEHKYFAPWEQPHGSTSTVEHSHACGPDDEPYYPIRLAEDQTMLTEYLAAAAVEPGVTFVGRLGTYRYLDMDVAISEALHAARVIVASIADGAPIPAIIN